jgi:hypothetical protein
VMQEEENTKSLVFVRNALMKLQGE